MVRVRAKWFAVDDDKWCVACMVCVFGWRERRAVAVSGLVVGCDGTRARKELRAKRIAGVCACVAENGEKEILTGVFA